MLQTITQQTEMEITQTNFYDIVRWGELMWRTGQDNM